MAVIEFKLEAFEGPLDLLLRLIEKNKIDIYDIPIAQLTDQYLEVIRPLTPGESDMEGMSEFLLMAATLLEIKSRMLLPKPAAASEEEADPRDALVQKLLAYKQCQMLAEQLKSAAAQGERFTRAADTEWLRQFSISAPSPLPVLLNVEPDALWAIFTDVLKRKELRTDKVRAGYGDMPRERFTVEEKIVWLSERLARHGQFTLREIFEACETRAEMVATFLAVLEMARRGQAGLWQPHIFGDIQVSKAG